MSLHIHAWATSGPFLISTYKMKIWCALSLQAHLILELKNQWHFLFLFCTEHKHISKELLRCHPHLEQNRYLLKFNIHTTTTWIKFPQTSLIHDTIIFIGYWFTNWFPGGKYGRGLDNLNKSWILNTCLPQRGNMITLISVPATTQTPRLLVHCISRGSTILKGI